MIMTDVPANQTTELLNPIESTVFLTSVTQTSQVSTGTRPQGLWRSNYWNCWLTCWVPNVTGSQMSSFNRDSYTGIGRWHTVSASDVPCQRSTYWAINTPSILTDSNFLLMVKIFPCLTSIILQVLEILWNIFLRSGHEICTLSAKCNRCFKVKSQPGIVPKACSVSCQPLTFRFRAQQLSYWYLQYIDWHSPPLISPLNPMTIFSLW